ncbi:MAG: nucleotide exchange factor GrpE [Candidatus Gastranaerophilales bacterium]|nr:nucleotide exchange factor GrpE [Candidatus Gastranaerophilales bacterium]
MKNFFENKLNKGNPFVSNKDNKGDSENTMTDEIKEAEQENQEIVEETENAEEAVQEEAVEETNETEAEKLKLALDNLNNQYLRLAADFENYRKRQAQEREALLKYGAEECMKKVLEVVDNFDRALTMVDKIEDLDKMKETFQVLNKQLMDSLTKLGLEQIKCVGEQFDPNVHEAVMQTPTDEHPEDTVIKELQKGYKLGEKVLRPAMVAVAVKQ